MPGSWKTRGGSSVLGLVRVQQSGALRREVVAKIKAIVMFEPVDERARVEIPDGAQPDFVHEWLRRRDTRSPTKSLLSSLSPVKTAAAESVRLARKAAVQQR